MRLLVLFIITSITSNCSLKKSNKIIEDNKNVQKTVYKQRDINSIAISSLNKVSNSIKSSVESHLGWEVDVDLYNFLHIDDNASIYLLNSIRGRNLYLILIDKNNNVIKSMNLTEDNCSLIDQYEDYELIHCKYIESMIQGNKLTLCSSFIKTKDFGNKTENIKYSIVYNYSLIGDDINLIKKDSLRLVY